MIMDIQALAQIAIDAALAAGKVIRKYANDKVIVEKKEGGSGYASQVVTTVDRECESVIFSHLLPTSTTFDIAILSEETDDDGKRFKKDFFWCVDPMDGTLAFINKKPGFSVSIALIAKDGTPYIGVVFDPSTNILYHAVKGKGVYKNRKPWKIYSENDYLTYVTDKSLKDTPQNIEIQKMITKQLARLNLKGVKELAGAGAVLNAILVAENRPACMIKLPKKENGGGSVWDFAATACIFQELGLSATNFKGENLDLNKKQGTFMNDKGIFYANFNMNN